MPDIALARRFPGLAASPPSEQGRTGLALLGDDPRVIGDPAAGAFVALGLTETLAGVAKRLAVSPGDTGVFRVKESRAGREALDHYRESQALVAEGVGSAGLGTSPRERPGCISKWRWGAVSAALPVWPTYPTTSPAVTRPEERAKPARWAP